MCYKPPNHTAGSSSSGASAYEDFTDVEAGKRGMPKFLDRCLHIYSYCTLLSKTSTEAFYQKKI